MFATLAGDSENHHVSNWYVKGCDTKIVEWSGASLHASLTTNPRWFDSGNNINGSRRNNATRPATSRCATTRSAPFLPRSELARDAALLQSKLGLKVDIIQQYLWGLTLQLLQKGESAFAGTRKRKSYKT